MRVEDVTYHCGILRAPHRVKSRHRRFETLLKPCKLARLLHFDDSPAIARAVSNTDSCAERFLRIHIVVLLPRNVPKIGTVMEKLLPNDLLVPVGKDRNGILF